jgi:methionine-rich copper-binding protein CopC
LVPTAAVAVVMTAMPGMPDHGDMFIRNFTQTWSDNNRKLTLTLKKPLQTGTYDIRWQAAGADGHRMSGKVTFTVK